MDGKYILEVLETEMTTAKKQRDFWERKLNVNNYQKVIEIDKKLATKAMTNREALELLQDRKKYMKKAKQQNKNLLNWMDKICDLDKKIDTLSSEIARIEIRLNHYGN